MDYLELVQERQYENDQIGYVEQFWVHHDKAMDDLLTAMRSDYEVRFVLLEREATPGSRASGQIAAPKVKGQLGPGSDS